MKNPKVFVDFHHASLLHSFILLFEGRLGGRVYRPIGMEWAEKGFWKVYDHPATQAQFLGIGSATPDGTDPVNEVLVGGNGIYLCQDIDSGLFNRAITYDLFMQMDMDIVIASIPEHIEPFKRLCELHPNRPKLIFQIGNAWTVEAGLAPNIMASAIINDVPSNINFVTYHQEFDLGIFKPDIEAQPEKNIFAFINCFNLMGHFKKDWELFQATELLLPDWNFKSFGGQCRDGAMHGSSEVARGIKEARFIWHTKNAGDGYGHIVHNIGAIGRPMITKLSDYRGKLAEKLMIDGETCINVDGLNAHQIVDKIKYYDEHSRYTDMCKRTYDNFKENVDFDRDAELVNAFLDRLI